ncbi:MAG: hypothetical protein AB1815_14220 [Bacillota bacterium]
MFPSPAGEARPQFSIPVSILPHLVKLCRLNVVLSLDSANIQRGLIPPLNEVSSDS